MNSLSDVDSHPLHPAIVHWPLAFLTSAFGIDVLLPMLQYLPTDIAKFVPSSTELTRISYYALSAGLLTAVPALISGILQAGSVMKKQGDIYEADKKTLKPKVKTLFTHAGLNDAVLLASTGYWWLRRRSGGETFQPEPWMLGLSVVLGSTLLFTASLGRTLVYNYGTGLRTARAKEQ
jgi:uncharacterized membrane protein